MKIKIRKSWGDMKPITKRIDSSKIYKRKGKFTKWNLEDWKTSKPTVDIR
jgi:hypothetical protein